MQKMTAFYQCQHVHIHSKKPQTVCNVLNIQSDTKQLIYQKLLDKKMCGKLCLSVGSYCI